MAGYTRQSTFADGDTITAALFNNEYNQVLNAFSNTGGHKHDGTAAEGPVIGLIGDAGETSPNNKVLIDTTNNFIEFYVQVSSSSVQQLYIADGAIIPVTDSDIDLGTTSLRFKDTYTDTITTTGNVAVGGNLTVTGTTTFNGGTITMGDAATDNVVFGADVDSNIIPDDDDSYDLGSSSQEWRNLYIDGTANIDSLVADTADINGGTIDGAVIGGSSAAAITGTTITGTAITGTSFVIGSANISEAELEILDGATVTTAELNILDGVTSTAAELNILDGVTSTAAEINLLDGVTSTTAELNILDGVTSTAAEINLLDGVTSTTAELNILDGVTASAADINLIDGITNGTVIASKAIITDANKDITGGRNITITGELDAATLDISGNADIDGTLETDALSINGTTVTSTAAELNILDGVTATAAEINALDGITSTVAELNILDGVTSTAAELNLLDGKAFLDEDDMSSNSATGIASQQSIKAYVDTQITAEDLDITTDSGTIAIDLDSETLTVSGGTGLDSSATGNAVTLAIDSTVATLTGSQTLTNKSLTAPTLTGTAVVASLDISGDIDVDGTTNLDVVDIDGAVDMASTLNVSGAITGTLATAAQTNITSLGTLTALTGGTGDLNWDSGTLFVDSSANAVGIGTTSPQLPLHVKGGFPTAVLERDAGAAGASSLVFTNSTTNGIYVSGSDEIYTVGHVTDYEGSPSYSERMRIDSSGNVGIGTTSPAYSLDVQSSATTGIVAMFSNEANQTSEEALIWIAGQNKTNYGVMLGAVPEVDTPSVQDHAFIVKTNDSTGTDHTERFRISSDGNVGIGTSSFNATYDPRLQVTSAASDGTGGILIQNYLPTLTLEDISGGAAVSQIQQDQTNMLFKNNGSERMRIDSSGNLLVGATSAYGTTGTTINAAGLVYSSADGDRAGQFDRTTSDGELVRFSKAGTTAGSIGGGATFLTIGSGTGNVYFQNGVMAPTASASGASSNGVIDLGTSSSKFKNLYLSGGVYANNASGAFLWNAENAHIAFGTNNTERMRIDSSGNVGIGQSSPSSFDAGADNLVIGDTGDSSTGLTIASSSSGIIYFADGTTGDQAYRGAISYSHPIDSMIFRTGGFNERMRIDSSGNVGINNTECSHKLHVEENGTGAITSIRVANENTSVGDGSQILFTSGTSTVGAAIASYGTALNEASLLFKAGGDTERMRIDSSGRVFLGTTSQIINTHNHKLGVVAAGVETPISTDVNETVDRYAIDFHNPNGRVGNVLTNGTSTSFNTSSDARLKEVTGYARGLEVINKLNPVSYNWKVDGKADEGLIAQEVLDIVPNAVSGSEEEQYYMDYSKLVVYLVKGMKEQQTQIDALQSEINLLKGE